MNISDFAKSNFKKFVCKYLLNISQAKDYRFAVRKKNLKV